MEPARKPSHISCISSLYALFGSALNASRSRMEPTGPDDYLGIAQRGRVNRMLVTLFTFLPRRRFQRAIALKLKILERTLTKVQLEKTMAEKSGRHTMICRSNATLYLLLFNLDLTVLLHQLALEQHEIKRKVFSKHIISLLYEFFEDFPQVFGDKGINSIIADWMSGDRERHLSIVDPEPFDEKRSRGAILWKVNAWKDENRLHVLSKRIGTDVAWDELEPATLKPTS